MAAQQFVYCVEGLKRIEDAQKVMSMKLAKLFQLVAEEDGEASSSANSDVEIIEDDDQTQVIEDLSSAKEMLPPPPKKRKNLEASQLGSGFIRASTYLSKK